MPHPLSSPSAPSPQHADRHSPELAAGDVPAHLSQWVEPLFDSDGPLGWKAESIPLAQALHRVLAQDVTATVDVPPHDNAAMDGHAFRGDALRPGHDLVLPLANGVLRAGGVWSGPDPRHHAVRIMTGAPMPPGLDTVVPLELAFAPPGADHLRIPAGAVRPGQHRRPAGEDVKAGHAVLPKGRRLQPADLGLVASLGWARVPVWPRLRVGLLCVGDELLSPGEPARPGAVYNSHTATLLTLLQRMGCTVHDLGAVADDAAALRGAVAEAQRDCDVLLTSGGLGGGDADHTVATLRELALSDPTGRCTVQGWHTAVRPGRPMAAGHLPRTGSQPPLLWLGLPGNPVAMLVGVWVFVRPVLLRRMGVLGEALAPPLALRAHALEPLPHKPGRTEYLRGVVSRTADGGLVVRSSGPQGSGVLRSVTEANALVVLPATTGPVAVGQAVDVWLLDTLW